MEWPLGDCREPLFSLFKEKAKPQRNGLMMKAPSAGRKSDFSLGFAMVLFCEFGQDLLSPQVLLMRDS